MSANDRQVGGGHYKGHSKEHWDLVAEYGWDYFQAQIIKYTMRWKEKNGVEDLMKAQHFLEKYIELQGQGEVESGNDWWQDAESNLVCEKKGDATPAYVNQDPDRQCGECGGRPGDHDLDCSYRDKG